MSQTDPLAGDPKHYRTIAWLLTAAFGANAFVILLLNLKQVEAWLTDALGSQRAFILQLYFWATLGATIACSIFLKYDKDINEVERDKGSPDPTVLRYPNEIDVWLYAQRILTSGFLGVVGAALFLAGLWYFDVPIAELTSKHRLFLVIVSFVIGVYQSNFLTALSSVSRRLLRQRTES